MVDQKKRFSLDFSGVETREIEPIPRETIQRVSKAAGLRTTSVAEPTLSSASLARPERRKTGRTQQFATRLRDETITQIRTYAESNRITLAETIELAIAALLDVKPK